MAMELITQVSSFRSGLAGGAPAGRVPSLPPDDQVEMFRMQVDAVGDPVPNAGAPDPAVGPDGVPPAHDVVRPARHVGDAILSGLSNLSATIESRWNRVKDAAQLPDDKVLTAAEMVSLQAGVQSFMVLYEIVGKGISRATQNLDALVKMQ